MPLPLPKLDNRTFDQLVVEGQLQIPRLAGAWTDHNASDPGITLVELLAWLLEMDIYRLDRTSLAMRATFLRRLGIEARPAQAAEAVLVWSTSGAVGLALPAGIQVDGPAGLVFETSEPLLVSPATLAGFLTQKGGLPAAAAQLPAAMSQPLLPFGTRPAVGDAFYLGFDQLPGSPAEEISLYFWTPDPAGDRAARQRLEEEWLAQLQDAVQDCQNAAPASPWQEHYRARITWEYFSADQNGWAALPGVRDETRALSLSGGLRFRMPMDMSANQPQAGAWFIRARLETGGYECPPQLAYAALNAAAARHAAQQPTSGLASEELLGISSGSAGQAFSFKQGPVVPGSIKLRVATPANSSTWNEINDIHEAGPHAAVFALNAARDALLVGDGRNGRIPPAGAKIWARYAAGGGVRGNLPARALDRPLPGPPNTDLVPGWAGALALVHIEQPYPALGGSEAEPLERVQGRALDWLTTTQRSVTLTDLARLAQETPGVPVARARALPNYYPHLPCVPAPGCVTLVVVAACPAERPEPSPELLRAVSRYLQRRLPLTTELHVIGPTFLEVQVSAALHLSPGADAAHVLKQAVERLDAFLNPLYGGPEQIGWPVGRDVYRSEVMALLHEINGVAHVSGLGLQGPEDEAPRCGNLPVCPDGLVTPGRHQIEIVADSPARGISRAGKGVCDDE